MSTFASVLDTSLVDGLREFYKNSWPSLCDLTIQCSDGNSVPACRLILAIHSEYFAAYFRQEENTSTIKLPQYDSKLMKIIVKSLVDFDENDLNEIGLDTIIRAADYFQIKDLVRIASEMIAEKITQENLNDIIELTHTVHSPILKEACFNFIKINIQDVFSIEKGILERLSTPELLTIFSKPWMPLLDKFKRQCDVLESTEILLHILHETLRSSDREKDLEEFINQSFNVEHLYYIFTQNQDIFTDDFDDVDTSNIYINHQRILPQKLDVENADLKQLVISTINQKYPNMSEKRWKFPGAVVVWHPITGRLYGNHGDIGPLTQGNSENWIVHGNIRKINIKSRLWDQREIIQGFQVFLANGETRAFGMELNNTTNVDTLEVPSDQHIKNFIVRCGWYIDAIAIETNQGQTLGPIGGNGGEFMDYIDIHYQPYMNRRSDSAHKYIDGIRGKTVISQDGPCICELEFKYVIVPWDSRFGWQTDTNPDSDTDSESSSES